MVETPQGERLPRALNERYLKNTTHVFGKTLEDKDGRYLNIALSIIFRQILDLAILYSQNMSRYLYFGLQSSPKRQGGICLVRFLL